MEEYINPNKPVYISYGWKNIKNQKLENDVNALCDLMKKNKILYFRDKEGLVNYRKNINQAEKQIGKGDAIIVFLSKKYITSPHCMHELHEIFENGDYEKRLFPIKLSDFPNLSSSIILETLKETVAEDVKTIFKKSLAPNSVLNDVEQSFIENDGYIKDIDVLKNYLENHNYYLAEDNKYETVINALYEYFGVENKTIVSSSTKSSNPTITEPEHLVLALKSMNEDKKVRFFDIVNNDNSLNIYIKPKEIIKIKEVIKEPPLNKFQSSQKPATLSIPIKDGVAIDMILVEGGTFMMGDNDNNYTKPVHQVTLDSYYIAKYPVTQKIWKTIMNNNPSNFKGENLPVEFVSWIDCQKFIEKLNKLTDREFKLPTEAQWEFAARGGNKSKGYIYSGTTYYLEDFAWVEDNSNKKTHPVGQKDSNELGIYDMSGNVWEWCNDWYDQYSREKQNNPQGPVTGFSRVFRGGCWDCNAWGCQVSYRRSYSPDGCSDSVGFRLAL